MLLCLAVIGMFGALAVNGCRDTLDPWDRGVLGGPPQAVLVSDTLFPDADTYVRKTQPNTNWGSATALSLGGGGWNRVLLRFDSTAIRTAVGAGTIDSAWLELTIQVAASGWGQNERTVDLHRLLKSWTELGATWNCAVDANTGNSVPNCTSQGWDMTIAGSGSTFAATRTDRVIINNGQTGIVRLNVTADIAALLDGSQVHHGWVFRKTGDALGGEGVVFSKESGSQPRLILRTTAPVLVPALPPDSVPVAVWDSLHTPANMEPAGTMYPVPFPRNLIRVWFKSGAPPSARQAAIDAIGGRVIGGVRIDDGGVYYVTIVDDGTTVPLFNAINVLKALPDVEMASPEALPLGPGYLRPTDGLNWKPSDWQVNPSLSPGGDNWALEEISAPLAWGCSVGSSLTRIGASDTQFDSLPDLAGNIAPQALPVYSTPGTSRHGTFIASILAAEGNNGIGMTGVMWRSQLDLREIVLPGPTPLDRVAQDMQVFVQHGVRVISSSQWVAWPAGRPIMTSTLQSPSDSIPLNIVANTFIHGVRQANQQVPAARQPLIVVLAGNTNFDSYWGGWGALQDTFPGQVLVVGSSSPSRALSSFSARGAHVEIVAPGESVFVLHGNGTVAAESGTSISAPMVAGVAGLLLAFDSSLTAAQLKTLLIQGAIRGGRTAGGIPILNAYESLKLAAARPGAPVCGNRVFFRGDSVFAQRGDSGAVEKIISGVPGNGTGSLDIRHSGHLIAVGGWMWRWNAGTWDTTSSYPVDLAHSTNGSTWGSGGVASMKHDLDSLIVITYGATVPGPFDVRMALVSDNSHNRLITSFSGVPGGTGVSPMGNELVVPVWRGDTGFTWDIYRVNSTTGAQTFLFARAGVDGVHATYSEDGREFSVAAYNQNGQCEIEFFRAATAVSVHPKVSYPAGLGFCRGIGMWGAARRAVALE